MGCYPSDRYTVLVRLHESPGAEEWIIQLEKAVCNCKEWQDLRLPYAHAFAAMLFHQHDLKHLYKQYWFH